MPSPDLLIVVGVTIKLRDDVSRWRQTVTLTETWAVDSTLEAYAAELDAALPGIWAFVVHQRSVGAEVTAHYSTRLENITAAAPPKGAWVQAKQHYDGALTSDELVYPSDIADAVSAAVASMKQIANY